MKRKMLAVFMMLWLGFVTSATAQQEASSLGVGKDKRGYGFTPGLVPGQDFVAGQLIVGLKDGVSTRGIQSVRQTAIAARGTVVREIAGSTLLLGFASEQEVQAAVPALAALPEVAYVERNGFMRIPPRPLLPRKGKGLKGQPVSGGIHPQVVSADRGTGYQWHHTVIRKTAVLPALVATPPTVAVIDTGVDYTHADLVGKVILGRNVVNQTNDPFDDNEHGTHVAGIIAARAGNGFYGEGVCPNCKILAVKVLDSTGSGSFFDVASGMAYVVAVRNATVPRTRVVNMSLGGPNSAATAAQVLAMKNAGLALVAAAGNSNTTSTTNAFPGADANTALRVVATEENDARAYFSNFSPAAAPNRYNIAAPGHNIFSTVPGEGFTEFSGTSMASPVVAGAAALVWGQVPALTRDQLVARLVTTGEAISKGFAAATRRVDVRKAILGTVETALVGRLLDPFTGRAPSPDTAPDNARLFLGATQLSIDGTNRGGSYEMTGLAAGTLRLLRGDRAGYVNSLLRSPLTVTAGLVGGPFTDAHALARPTGFATIVVDWWTIHPIFDTAGCVGTCNGWDLDLYVKQPAGTYIGFDNRGDLATTPFIRYARDSFDDLEPLETIVIGASAANGVYRVFVNRWEDPFSTPGLNPSWTGSLASTQIYLGAALSQNYPIHPATCAANAFWYVGNLTKTGTTYTWTNVNTCSNVLP